MQQRNWYHFLFNSSRKGVFALLDPDRTGLGEELIERVKSLDKEELIKGFFVGSSFLAYTDLDEYIKMLKRYTAKPVILFPSSHCTLSAHADVLLFLSLLSGRNPQYLVDEPLKMVPFIISSGIEIIPTAYLLIEGGRLTSVEYITGVKPIPRDKVDIIKHYAKLAEFFGFKLVYLEAGSGARYHVEFDIIKATAEFVNIPVIVGGGFRNLKDIEKALEAGAQYVVVGTAIERGEIF